MRFNIKIQSELFKITNLVSKYNFLINIEIYNKTAYYS